MKRALLILALAALACGAPVPVRPVFVGTEGDGNYRRRPYPVLVVPVAEYEGEKWRMP